MYRTYFFALVYCALLSCSDDSLSNASQSIDDIVRTNELWQINLEQFNPNGVVIYRITKEAENAELSEIRTGIPISYFYRSTENFTGVEFITIESCSSPGNDDFTCIDINIELQVIE